MSDDEIKKGLEALKNRKGELDRLRDASLDLEYYDREEDRKAQKDQRRRRRSRVHHALTMSENKEGHRVRGAMEKCSSYQYVRRRKERYWYGDMDFDFNVEDGGVEFSRGYKSTHLTWLMDQDSDGNFVRSRRLDLFRDRKGHVDEYVKRKEVCQSLWCPNCRKFVTKLYENKVRNHMENRLIPTGYQNEDLRQITGALGLCKVNVDELNALIKKDEERWRKIRYRVDRHIGVGKFPWIECVYEFELVNRRFLMSSENGSEHKKKQINQLIKEYGPVGDNVFLFVHFHGITNLNDEDIRKVFRDEYYVGDQHLNKTNKETGLYVQRLYKGKTLDENLEKLCSYPFKDPIRFKHSFRGSDYKNGEFFSDEELSSLVAIYQKFQGRNWRRLFRSVVNKVSDEVRKASLVFDETYVEMLRRNYRNTEWFWNTIKVTDPGAVWLVDTDGVVMTGGWSPDLLFKKGGVGYVFLRYQNIDDKKYRTPNFNETDARFEVTEYERPLSIRTLVTQEKIFKESGEALNNDRGYADRRDIARNRVRVHIDKSFIDTSKWMKSKHIRGALVPFYDPEVGWRTRQRDLYLLDGDETVDDVKQRIRDRRLRLKKDRKKGVDHHFVIGVGLTVDG